MPACAELHARAPQLPSGRYALDPDAEGPEPPLSAYCDMDSDGGGWTVLYASDGRDGNVPLVSHEVVEGNPLAFEPYNLHSFDKVWLADVSEETLVRRPGTAWLVADAPPLSPEVLVPVSEGYVPVTLRRLDGGRRVPRRRGARHAAVSRGPVVPRRWTYPGGGRPRESSRSRASGAPWGPQAAAVW